MKQKLPPCNFCFWREFYGGEEQGAKILASLSPCLRAGHFFESEDVSKAAAARIFSESQSDSVVYTDLPTDPADTVIIWEYLPGQYDQRADSAEQCLSLLRESMKNTATVGTEPPRVRCTKMVILSGSVSADEVARIQKYLINPVDSRLASAEIPETLEMKSEIPADIPTVDGFISFNKKELDFYREKMGLAMVA